MPFPLGVRITTYEFWGDTNTSEHSTHPNRTHSSRPEYHLPPPDALVNELWSPGAPSTELGAHGIPSEEHAFNGSYRHFFSDFPYVSS